MPERFDLTYTGADDAPHRPVMIHRALLGSMERFAGILIEHYAGRFPVWLAPVQAIGAAGLRPPRRLRRGGRGEAERRAASGSRSTSRSESVGKKIRDAELGRYPYMLVVGDREQETGEVAVRSHARRRAGGDGAARVRGPRPPRGDRLTSILAPLVRRHAKLLKLDLPED